MFLFLIRTLHHWSRLVQAGPGWQQELQLSICRLSANNDHPDRASEFSGEKVILHREKGVVHLDLSFTANIGCSEGVERLRGNSRDEVRRVMRLRDDDVDRGQLPLRLLQGHPAQLGRLHDDLSGVCVGKYLLAGTDLARTCLGSVFLQKLLFLSPESGVEVAVEDH